MNCPHCGRPVELVRGLEPEPLDPPPLKRIREEHTRNECRIAVAKIKKSPTLLFLKEGNTLAEIRWAKTIYGKLYVQIMENYYAPVYQWGDIVDCNRQPFLGTISE